jgi:sarcosine oxidase delta subunit
VDRLTLLPCPFCGREPQQRMIHTDGDERTERYLAASCQNHTDWITVEQWNRRRSLSQEAVRNEALEKAARACERHLYGTEEFQFGVRTCIEAIGALKREPNAAAGASDD